MRGVLTVIGVVLATLSMSASAFAQSPSGGPRIPRGDQNAGPCPQALALYDAVRVVNFEGPDEVISNVGFTAEIQSVRSLCRYRDDDPIRANLEIDFGFGRGPAAAGREHTYTYWVAVTRRNQSVIHKEFFPIEVRFDRDEERTFVRETIDEIVIPRASSTVSGNNFEIIVGFELTPEQLEFNRLGKRFTMMAASQ